MATAAPPRPIDATAATDAEFEALIREARRHARRRRAVMAVVIAVVTAAVVAGFVASAASRDEPTAPAAEMAQADDAPTAPITGSHAELLVSMHLHHSVSRYGDVWLYVYDDGRLVLNGADWELRQLTPEGAIAVRDMMVAEGVFDQAELGGRSGYEPCCGDIQARVDGTLVVLPHSVRPDTGADGMPTWYRVAPSYDLVVDRLMTLPAWLPDDMWLDKDPTRYRPDSFAVCASATDESSIEVLPYSQGQAEALLPPPAATILAAQPNIPTVSVDADRLYGDHTLPNVEGSCRHVSADDAVSLAAALVSAGWADTHGLDHRYARRHLDTTLHVDLIPMLPHGVPALTYG
ncbi:hypothetical protein ACH3VR_11165 [Microbacterium sp. B2969]|uniref:Uncharacterized protein n=1 Tax=Microbacterium alkaliflavum TaxID=3248839 RepID=A0ABW7Q7T5_9MICO